MNKKPSIRFLLFITTSLIASVTFADERAEHVDKLVKQVLTEFEIPGVALGVAHKGETLLLKGYGVTNIQTNAAVDSNTIFKIASNSKAFTSAAMAILVDRKKLSWQDKVVDYLPDFQLYDSEVTQQFNMIDLLTHRSGLRIGAGDLMLWPEPTNFTRQDIVKNLRYLKPVSEFRNEYAYDNLLYIVAGEVVSKVSGQSFEKFVEENIFSKLKMTRCFSGGVPLSFDDNRVAPHANIGGELQILNKNVINDKTSIMAAAGGIKCSAKDLISWTNRLLADHASNEQSEDQLISKRQMDELWRPQTKLTLSKAMRVYDKATSHDYALGWRISDYFGHRRVAHTGMLGGSMSQIVLFPELELSFVILTNQQSSVGRNALMRELLTIYVPVKNGERKSVDWLKHYSNKNSSSVTSLKRKISSLKEIEISDSKGRLGNYFDSWFGKVSLKTESHRILFQSEMSPRMRGKVYQHKDGRWWVKWDDRSFDADAWLNFRINKSSKLVMTMKAISKSTDFSFDFEDLNLIKK